MSNVHIDYFKANYVSDGKTGHLEINDNGEYTYEKINEEKRKLEVMVKIFGRKTPLELSYMQVEKV